MTPLAIQIAAQGEGDALGVILFLGFIGLVALSAIFKKKEEAKQRQRAEELRRQRLQNQGGAQPRPPQEIKPHGDYGQSDAGKMSPAQRAAEAARRRQDAVQQRAQQTDDAASARRVEMEAVRQRAQAARDRMLGQAAQPPAPPAGPRVSAAEAAMRARAEGLSGPQAEVQRQVAQAREKARAQADQANEQLRRLRQREQQAARQRQRQQEQLQRQRDEQQRALEAEVLDEPVAIPLTAVVTSRQTAATGAGAGPARRVDLSSKDRLRQGILMAEILGPPRALRELAQEWDDA